MDKAQSPSGHTPAPAIMPLPNFPTLQQRRARRKKSLSHLCPPIHRSIPAAGVACVAWGFPLWHPRRARGSDGSQKGEPPHAPASTASSAVASATSRRTIRCYAVPGTRRRRTAVRDGRCWCDLPQPAAGETTLHYAGTGFWDAVGGCSCMCGQCGACARLPRRHTPSWYSDRVGAPVPGRPATHVACRRGGPARLRSRIIPRES